MARKKVSKKNVMTDRDREVADVLMAMADSIVEAAESGQDPRFAIPVRSLSNVSFNTKRRIIEMGDAKVDRQFFNLSMAKKFMQTILIASMCKKELLETGKTTSIRDMYYMIKHTIGRTKENTVDDQSESDPIIEDLEVTLQALREELHLFASNRGSMVGPMILRDGGDTINLTRMGTGGWSVPSIVEPNVIEFVECKANYILLVEKDAVWRRLNEDKFWKKHKCMLITGQGQPPRGVRRLIHRMHNELRGPDGKKLPVYVFVDNDPWGYYIYSVIKQGSINLAYESMRMAVPEARFLGLSAFDLDRYELGPDVQIRLNKQDVARCDQIMAYDWFKDKKWQRELKKMKKNGVKLELEALSSKGISFVTDTYLPEKIAAGAGKGWLT